MTPLSRRDLLIAGAGVAAGGVLGASTVQVLSTGIPAVGTPSATPAPLTVNDWIARREPPYYIGHRGVGAVMPEHTLPSYLQALAWGAECIEVSVVQSSDGVLYCHHDLTLDRTTTLTGDVRSHHSSELDQARVSVPRLGPRWSGQNMPLLPRLEEVLTELGGKAVLCIEPKDDAAYDPLISLVNEQGLADGVMVKLDASSGRLAQAKEAGFARFAYLGNAEVATPAAVAEVAATLDPVRDALVLPARDGHDLMPADLFRTAVATGVPVWVFPVHRRREADYFAYLGVEGMVTSCIGYVAGSIPRAVVDDWASGQLTAGQLTRDPYVDAFALDWSQPAVATIPTPGRPAFVTFGQFAPVDAPSYRISFDACFDPLPNDTWQHLSIAFCRADDRYYEHRLGDGDGYHAILRADGSMSLFAHVDGQQNGEELVTPAQSQPLSSGVWARMTLDVTPQAIRWTRDDGTAVEARDQRFRGGYFHVGSSAAEGAIRLRALSVS